MTKPNYHHIISLSEEDEARLEKLQKEGIKIIDIFKKGLERLEKEVFKT